MDVGWGGGGWADPPPSNPAFRYDTFAKFPPKTDRSRKQRAREELARKEYIGRDKVCSFSFRPNTCVSIGGGNSENKRGWGRAPGKDSEEEERIVC